MSGHKIGGCCSLCDEPCFDITAVWEEGSTRAGEPKSLGEPHQGATRIAFLLLSGGYTDMTFCRACAEALNPEHYTRLWRKNLSGYARFSTDLSNLSGDFANVLLCELGRHEITSLQRGNLLG